jgi:hypothetical protein
MKKIIVYFLLLSKLVYSQELVNSIPINLDKINDFIRLDDSENKCSILIIKNKENFEFVKTDENFKIISQFENSQTNKLGDFIGNSIQENIIYTYWKKNNKTIEVLIIDFAAKKVSKTEINYPIQKSEKILCSYSKDNFFYIISIIKETSLIKYYSLNGINVAIKSINCSNLTFLSSLNTKVNLWGLLNNESGTVYKADFPVFFFDKLNLNSVHATEKKKIYIDNEKIIISSDIHDNFSQLVRLSLIDFTAISYIISKEDGKTAFSTLEKDTNSFIIDDKIFIAIFTNESLSVIIKNFDNNTLNSFTINAIDGHEYINSELIEESGGINNKEIIKSEEKFFRRSYAKNPSITGNISNGNYNLTIAGVSYPRQQSYQMLGMFGFVGGLTAAIINDGSGSSITSYTNKIVVYIRSCVSASDFKPTNTKNFTPKYDSVRAYVENNNSKENFLNLFEKNNNYYLLAHKNKEDKILIYKF